MNWNEDGKHGKNVGPDEHKGTKRHEKKIKWIVEEREFGKNLTLTKSFKMPYSD